MCDKVDRIVQSIPGIEIVIELFQSAAVFENQDLLIGLQFRENRILFRNRTVDDNQFLVRRDRDIGVREQRIRQRPRIPISRDRISPGGEICGVGHIRNRQFPVDELIDLRIHIPRLGRVVHSVVGVVRSLLSRIFRRSVLQSIPLALCLAFGLIDIGIRIVRSSFRRLDNLRHCGRLKENAVFEAKHFHILRPHASPRQSMTFPIRRS